VDRLNWSKIDEFPVSRIVLGRHRRRLALGELQPDNEAKKLAVLVDGQPALAYQYGDEFALPQNCAKE
jgi:hypothetical protein